MKNKIWTLIFAIQCSYAMMQYVYNTIENETKFHYRRLSKYPSKSATIRYSFTYKISEPGTRMELYTRDDHANKQNNCSLVHYEQLLNDKLYVAAFDDLSEESPCKIDLNFDHRLCEGTKRIQDYIPRHYYFSFGIDCDGYGSLQGLSYNMSILEQSNHTECLLMPLEPECRKYYSYTATPNLIGGDNIVWATKQVETGMKYLDLIANGSGRKPCYQHYQELFCYTVLPKCDINSTILIPPCKEACLEFTMACFEELIIYLDVLSARYTDASYWKNRLLKHTGNPSELFGCNYLPSEDEHIPCFYKPISCDNPTNITNAVIKNQGRKGNGFNLSAEVEYSCVGNTLMKGKNKRTCLYSGEWSEGPECVNISISSPLKIVLPLLIIPFFFFIVMVIIMKCRNKHSLIPYLRQKKYDAFVCYSYEGADSDFAEKTIKIQMEDKREFKLCIHRRDFLAAWDIKWNIMNAIRNSNSAIIVLSQDYVNSLWCVEEFEDCYMEHMKDPTFKLFVIMMQPAETMNITNEYIKCFLSKSTYLEREDPELFKKIAEYLTWVKKPKKGLKLDENVELPDTNENCTEMVPLQYELQI